MSDVDRAVEFYGSTVGWSVDHDQTPFEGLRFVQVTPPGSACSFCFGIGLDMIRRGAHAAHPDRRRRTPTRHTRYLSDRGVECTDVEELAWGRFVHFRDPDGNLWSMQQLVIPDSS